jgi:hypothetical protein
LFNFVYFFERIIMKATRIATLALLATAALGFNAFASGSDTYQPEPAQKFVSVLSRAQVQEAAVAANLDNFKSGPVSERGAYSFTVSPQTSNTGLSRDAVRAEAIKNAHMAIVNDHAG